MKYTEGKWIPRNTCFLTDMRICVYPIIKKGKAYAHFRNAIANTDGTHIDGVLIANAYGKTKEMAEANAKLIASAPELLEALKSTIFDVKQRCDDLDLECEKYPTWIKANEAIKKAE